MSEFPVVVVEHIRRPRSEQDLLRTRNRIIELVMRGKCTRERANELARQRGLEPFQSEPDVSRFDPMTQADWTLAMATAWILKRTPEAVREAWAEFACECWDWQRFEGDVPNRHKPGAMLHLVGWKPGPGAAPTPRSVLDRARENREGLVTTPGDAEDKLRAALRQGDPLVARYGRKAEPIDKNLWGPGRLSPFTSPRVRGPHDAVFNADGEVAFKGVTVERDAVIALWDRRPGDAAPIAAEVNAGGRKVVLRDEEQLRALMTNPPVRPGLDRKDYKAEAVRRNGGGLVDQGVIFKLHSDPAVYPGRPGLGAPKGPRKSS